MKAIIRLFVYLSLVLLLFACGKKNVKAEVNSNTPSPLPIIDVKNNDKQIDTVSTSVKESNTKDYLAFDEKIVKVTGIARPTQLAVKRDATDKAITIYRLNRNDKIKVLGKIIVDDQEEGFQKTTGIVTDDHIRVRTGPNLQATIIGLLKEGQQVDVLEQSTEAMVIDHAREYWYFIGSKEIPKGGWIFGKYLKRQPNRLNEWYHVISPDNQKGWVESRWLQLEFQFVLKDLRITFFQARSASSPIDIQSPIFSLFDYDLQNLYEIDTHDLTAVNTLGRANDLDASMQRLKEMKETAYTRFLIFQRERLIDSPGEWSGTSPVEIYTRFRKGLTDGSFWQVLPPVISIGLTNTGFYAHMSSQLLCTRYNLNLNQDFFISELVVKNDGAAFFVQGISFEYTSSADSEVTYKDNAIFFIDKIENSIFPQLNNRYEITFISLSHCNLVDDYQIYHKLHLTHNLKFITEHKLDYFKGALYGIYDKVRYYPN